jgi:AraC family transcriptional regulator
MQRVLDHIDGRLDAPLSVEELSGVAAFSKYHFHRQFSELFGVSVHRYVQLARLKRASFELAFRSDVSILQVALNCGYEGPEAFARAFKRTFGQTPSAFRKQPDWASWHAACKPINDLRSIHMATEYKDDQVEIVDFPATPVAVMRHRGDPATVGDTVRRFIDWRRRAGLSPDVSATFNLLYTDPETTAPEDYQLDLCVSTRGGVTPNDDGVTESLIPEGRCAKLRLIGSCGGLKPAVSFLYADWLPGSGEEPRDFPVFVQRVSFYPDTPENETIIDVFLPLAPRA